MEHELIINISQHNSGYRFVVKHLYKLGLEDRVEILESDVFPSEEIAELKAKEFMSRLRTDPSLSFKN